MEIQYLGHSGFRLVHGRIEVVIDPYLSEDSRRLTESTIDPREFKPNFILLTHEHFDHCDKKVVSMLARKNKAKIIGPPPVERKLGMKIIKVRPGNQLDYPGFTLRATPAFHHQSELPVGFLLDFDDLRVYHAGDTMYNDELTKISTDVALLPIGGTYTMTAEEALQLAEGMGPKIVIPMHFDTFEDIPADPYELAKRSNKFVVLKEGEVMEVNL